MQWVETTAKTVDEAVELALDQLGVARDDAEIDVVDEPKTGLFGRVRGEARVRVRVRPVTPRAKEERRDRKPRAEKAAGGAPVKAADEKTDKSDNGDKADAGRKPRTPRGTKAVAAAGTPRDGSARDSSARDSSRGESSDSPRPRRSTPSIVHTEVPADVAEIGSDFLVGLVDAFGLEAKVSTGVVGDGLIEFRLEGADLGVLIGPKGQTLLAVQDLLRSIVHYGVDRDTGRIVLDVSGYRERRRKALEEFTNKVAAEVLATGEIRSLEPMTPADRKVVHDTVNDIAGIRSESEGEEPQRRVVLLPA
jgi:spoIIIJ-associated protein